MSFLNSFFIKYSAREIGKDQFGNRYYENKISNSSGIKKRYVIYKGIAEPSKVPPLWHGWLHYLSDRVPADIENYCWQQAPLPNLTGSKNAYNPALKDNKLLCIHTRWQPK